MGYDEGSDDEGYGGWSGSNALNAPPDPEKYEPPDNVDFDDASDNVDFDDA